jgi:hypothetical protein
MDDSYLWDRTGTPDPFTVFLETSLATRRAMVMRAGMRHRRPWRWLGLACLSVAAAGLIAFVSFAMASGPPATPSDPSTPPGPAVAVDTKALPVGGGRSMRKAREGCVDAME